MNQLSRVRQQGESLKAYHERLAANHAAVLKLTRPVAGAVGSRESLRNAQRKNGNLRGVFGLGIIAAQTRRQLAALAGRKPDYAGLV